MITTSDLWNCAFLVSKGIEIDSIQVNETAHNNKYAVYFIFTDPKADELNKQFLNGKATGNITQIKLCMNHLKDIMHDKLRERKVFKNENNFTGNHKQSIRKRYSKNY